jgi:DNA-binding transcriptional regulator YiaG
MSKSAWNGKRILKIREALDLTQEEFARRLGVIVTTVSRWENGHVTPRGLSIRALETCETESAAKAKGKGKP